jgi:hypothetical protein
LQGGQVSGSLNGIAVAQRRAGFIEEAAATFEEALTAIISEKWNTIRLVSLIHVIVDNDRGKVLLPVSPTLRIRLVEAADAISGAWLAPEKVRIASTAGETPAADRQRCCGRGDRTKANASMIGSGQGMSARPRIAVASAQRSERRDGPTAD